MKLKNTHQRHYVIKNVKQLITTPVGCNLNTALPVVVDEPHGEFLRSCPIPVDSVSLLQGDHRLVLLVVVLLPKSPHQRERVLRVLVFDHLHVQVSWVTGLNVNLSMIRQHPNPVLDCIITSYTFSYHFAFHL